jgi:hypothetical protein
VLIFRHFRHLKKGRRLLHLSHLSHLKKGADDGILYILYTQARTRARDTPWSFGYPMELGAKGASSGR